MASATRDSASVAGVFRFSGTEEIVPAHVAEPPVASRMGTVNPSITSTTDNSDRAMAWSSFSRYLLYLERCMAWWVFFAVGWCAFAAWAAAAAGILRFL